MLKTSIFKIQVNCPGCNMYHTITGINETETCQNCGKTISLDKFFRSQLFGGADTEKYMYAFLTGNIEQMGGSGGVGNTGSYRLSYSSMPVYCEECTNQISDEEILSSINNKGPVKCSACSHTMPVKEADSFLKSFHPKAVAVINDSAGIDARDKSADKDAMVVFTCMSCGAGLELNKDTGRTMKCNFCGNENYLPDAVWTKLHPNKEVCPLFVILDVDGKDMEDSINYFLTVTMMKVYDRHFEKFIPEYFASPFTSDAFNSWLRYFLSARNNEQVSYNMDIEKIQRSFYSQVSLGYENHNPRLREITAEFGYKIPPDLQQKMANDSDRDIRISLAKNTSLEKEIIKKLQNDSDPLVASEAKKHKTGFFKSLFG